MLYTQTLTVDIPGESRVSQDVLGKVVAVNTYTGHSTPELHTGYLIWLIGGDWVGKQPVPGVLCYF